MRIGKVILQKKIRHPLLLVLVAVFLIGSVATAPAQSADQNLPTPVSTNEIKATIAALDVGDPRLTRHFYAFEAAPGDLLVTVNSRNLNGDVDIFTAITFRPLTKVTIYEGISAPEVSKSLYFRSREILILRVEARTPNDDPGTYQITFGGSFQPFTGGIPVAENTPAETEPDKKDARTLQRLSSVGATIPRPPGEVVESKPPETPVEKPAEEKPPEEKPVTSTPPTRRRTASTPPRRTTSRRTPPRTARTTPPKTETPKTETEQPKTEEPKSATEEAKSEEKPATAKPSLREGTGARLIIEQTDGTRIDRPMSAIRRVIVETNAIVIILRTGRIERIAMSSVARMAIEP